MANIGKEKEVYDIPEPVHIPDTVPVEEKEFEEVPA